MKKPVVGLMLATIAGAALAQGMTPVGLWKTVDEKTGKEQSYVRITESNGILSGKIEKVIEAAKVDAKCEKCTDERKDQPVQGMVIIRNVKKAGDGLWDGGDVLDPHNGKVYSVRLRPEEGGKTLSVRGYIGMPMLGRSQSWIRIE